MQVTIKEASKTKALFAVEGADHAMAGVLKDALWEDSATTAAGYSVAHPLVGVPEFVLETSKKDPKKVISEAVTRTIKKIEKLQKDTKSLRV